MFKFGKIVYDSLNKNNTEAAEKRELEQEMHTKIIVFREIQKNKCLVNVGFSPETVKKREEYP